MENNTTEILKSELLKYEQEIKKLEEASEHLRKVISLMNGDADPATIAIDKIVAERERKRIIASKPAKAVLKKPSSGKIKFSKFILDILRADPDRVFYNKDFVKIADEEIKAGNIDKAEKDTSSRVGAYLYNFVQRGKIKKVDTEDSSYSGYQLISTEKKKDIPELDQLQEAVLDIVKKSKDISLDTIANNIRMSSEFLEISKNLNGSLNTSILKVLKDLKQYNIVTVNDAIRDGDIEYYSYNPKSNF